MFFQDFKLIYKSALLLTRRESEYLSWMKCSECLISHTFQRKCYISIARTGNFIMYALYMCIMYALYMYIMYALYMCVMYALYMRIMYALYMCIMYALYMCIMYALYMCIGPFSRKRLHQYTGSFPRKGT